MEIPKVLKNSLIITGVILSICFSMFSLIKYNDLIKHGDILTDLLIYGISFLPLYLMVGSLILTIKKRSKIGYFGILIISIYYFIRDIIKYFGDKEILNHNPYNLPDNMLREFVPSFEPYVLIAETIFIIIFLILAFNRDIRQGIGLRLKNYLMVLGLFFLFEFALLAFPYFTTTIENDDRLSPVLVTDYPKEIDSIIQLDLEKNYDYKSFDIKVVNPVSKRTVETGGKVEKFKPSIDTNNYFVTVQINLQNDSIEKDIWSFEFDNEGNIKYNYKIE